jgi:hypothetical protein
MSAVVALIATDLYADSACQGLSGRDRQRAASGVCNGDIDTVPPENFVGDGGTEPKADRERPRGKGGDPEPEPEPG